MYPESPGSGKGGERQTQRARPSMKPDKKPPRGGSSRKGFMITLLILLVCAAAVAVLFLWYLPNRDSNGADKELTARNLVRQARLTIDEAYSETGTYAPDTMTPASLNAITPDITFLPVSDTSAATSPYAFAEDGTVNYAGTQTSYAVGTVSAGGTAYGIIVENEDSVIVTYYLDSRVVDDWDQTAPDTTTAPGIDETTTPSDDDASEESTESTDTNTRKTDPVSVAQDLEALTLLRDSMVTVQSAYATVGTFESSELTPGLLRDMDPSLTFVVRDSDQAAMAPLSSAGEDSVDLYGTETTCALGVKSASGTTFGVILGMGGSASGNTYYVNGETEDWTTEMPVPVVGGLVASWG